MRPSIERLKSLFQYSPETGELISIQAVGRRPVGVPAGKFADHGYREVSLDGRKYREHVICWAIHYGEWPAFIIDHRDTVKTNNRIENLRRADKSKNAQNQKCRSDSETGMKGVGVAPSGGYRARVCLNGRRIERAGFKAAEDAKEFRDLLAEMMHGEFVRH